MRVQHTLPLATAYPEENPKNEPARQRSRSTHLKTQKAPVQGGCTGAYVATGLKRRQEGEHGSSQVTLTTTESGKPHVQEQGRMLRLVLIRSDGNDLLSTCLFKRRLREINRGGQHDHVSVLHVVNGLANRHRLDVDIKVAPLDERAHLGGNNARGDAKSAAQNNLLHDHAFRL